MIPIHLSSIPRGALVVTIWVCMSTQWEKSVSLSHWLPYTPSWCICGSCVRCGPNGKVFLSTDHPSDHPSSKQVKASVLQLHPSFTHCSCGSWFTIKQITQSSLWWVWTQWKSVLCPSTIHPSWIFWLFVYVILQPQSTSTHQCTREGWMDGKWSGNTFLLGFSSLVNHGG